MRTFAVIVAFALLVAPISAAALVGRSGVRQAVGHNQMVDRAKQDRETWKNFDADMATSHRDFAVPAKAGGKVKSPSRSK
jgi:hypothetical protein